jgi:hypothetical protein
MLKEQKTQQIEEENSPYEVTLIQVQRDQDIRLFTLRNRKTQQTYLLVVTTKGYSFTEISK